MKIRYLACLAVLLVGLQWVAIAIAADAAAIDAKIQLAAGYLLQPVQDEGVKRGFKLLVESIAMAAPETGFAAEFKRNVDDAGRLFESDSIFNERAIALLKRSYLLANSGKEFKMPAEISSIPQATERIQKQIEMARGSLKQGSTGECARLLLEAALMIVTPM